MTTDTQHQIRQAIRELHIDIEPNNRAVEVQAGDNAYRVSFRDRRGNAASVSIPTGADYKTIIGMIRTAWRGKADE